MCATSAASASAATRSASSQRCGSLANFRDLRERRGAWGFRGWRARVERRALREALGLAQALARALALLLLLRGRVRRLGIGGWLVIGGWLAALHAACTTRCPVARVWRIGDPRPTPTAPRERPGVARPTMRRARLISSPVVVVVVDVLGLIPTVEVLTDDDAEVVVENRSSPSALWSELLQAGRRPRSCAEGLAHVSGGWAQGCAQRQRAARRTRISDRRMS